jgi:hypothetical protein
MIHVHIDAQSPKWATGHYRFEQHYHFAVPGEQDVQYALGRIAELCEELRHPPRDEVPPQDAAPTEPAPEEQRIANTVEYLDSRRRRGPADE